MFYNNRKLQTNSVTERNRKIQEIYKDELNNECFDCGKANPDFISANNGVFICKDCMAIHYQFSDEISLIIKNNLFLLNEEQINYIYYGGNRKLLEFINYDFPQLQNFQPEILYKTQAMQYYRDKLYYLVEGGNKPMRPNEHFAYRLINNYGNFPMTEKREKFTTHNFGNNDQNNFNNPNNVMQTDFDNEYIDEENENENENQYLNEEIENENENYENDENYENYYENENDENYENIEIDENYENYDNENDINDNLNINNYYNMHSGGNMNNYNNNYNNYYDKIINDNNKISQISNNTSFIYSKNLLNRNNSFIMNKIGDRSLTNFQNKKIKIREPEDINFLSNNNSKTNFYQKRDNFFKEMNRLFGGNALEDNDNDDDQEGDPNNKIINNTMVNTASNFNEINNKNNKTYNLRKTYPIQNSKQNHNYNNYIKNTININNNNTNIYFDEEGELLPKNNALSKSQLISNDNENNNFTFGRANNINKNFGKEYNKYNQSKTSKPIINKK